MGNKGKFTAAVLITSIGMSGLAIGAGSVHMGLASLGYFLVAIFIHTVV